MKVINRWSKTILVLLLISVVEVNSVIGQTFELINTFDIGHGVTSLVFTNAAQDSSYQPLAIGIKNTNGPRWQSQGWIDLRNPLSGNLIRQYQIGDFVNALDYTDRYNGQANNEKLAVAVSSNARLLDMKTGKFSYMNNPDFSPISAIKFISDSLVVFSDFDGTIAVFGTKESNHEIPMKSEIQRSGSSSPRSLSVQGKYVYAGAVNEIQGWTLPDTSETWTKVFTDKTSPTENSIARVNYVSNSGPRGYLYSAEADSLTRYDLTTGTDVMSIPMKGWPTSVAIHDSLIAIGTKYDSVYVYNIDSLEPTYVGNFSTQNYTINAIAFGFATVIENGEAIRRILMATASAKGKIEVWKYMPTVSD